MKYYPSLRNLLISIFSVDVGLEESEEIAVLDRVLLMTHRENRLKMN